MSTNRRLAVFGSEGVYEREEREREREREKKRQRKRESLALLTHSRRGHLCYQWFQVVLEYLEHRVTACAPPGNNKVVI
jgi:hypothetical protein